MRGRTIIAAIGVTCTAAIAHAQTFDAASVRPNRAPQAPAGLIAMQPGRLVATEATLVQLIAAAHDVRDNQVLGAPAWAASERFDITATFAAGATRQQARTMLRSLLEDRFGLRAHTESREMAVYWLTVASKDGRLGAQLRRSGAACVPPAPPAGVPMPMGGPPPPESALRPLIAGPISRCPTMLLFGSVGAISGRAMLIDELAAHLTTQMARTVVNRTGLSGEFDIDLHYQSTNDPDAVGLAGLPAVRTAVQDQLGLRLEAGNGPVQVLIVDRAERPAAN